MPKTGATIVRILKMKCPYCGKGDIFINKHILPLNTLLRTVDSCTVCHKKIKQENDSAPGMNYAFTVIVYFLCFVAYAAIFGITYKDYSIYYALASSTTIVILSQPWIMRLSKVVYLNIFLKLKKE